jgi:Protein of unknown function (DUF1580)
VVTLAATVTSPACYGRVMLIHETLLDLREAAALPVFRRRGRAPHVSVVYRWIHAGILAPDGQRVRLETIKQPAGLMTSVEAVERFIHRLSGEHRATTPTPRTRQKQIDTATRELEAAGFSVGGAD